MGSKDEPTVSSFVQQVLRRSDVYGTYFLASLAYFVYVKWNLCLNFHVKVVMKAADSF